MARTSRNSFDRNKSRVKVKQQIGIPVVDSDFNEAQDIQIANAAETALACMSSLRATTSGPLREGFAIGNDWLPYATGTGTILITKGTLFVDGFQLVLENDLDLTTKSVTFPLVGGSDVYGFIYVDVVLADVDSVADPTLLIPYIGETSVRTVLQMTFRKSESAVDYATAYSAITALPVVAGATVWKGNTARIFLCRYRRTAASTTIAANQVYDLRQATPADLNLGRPMLRFHRAGMSVADDANGHADGHAVWAAVNGGAGTLTFGNRDVTTDADELLGLATITVPNGPKHRIAAVATTAGNPQEWQKLGSGSTNGVSPSGQGAGGFSLSDGQALGYLAPTAVQLLSDMRTKKGNAANVHSILPVPATGNPLTAIPLQVQNLSVFEANIAPGTFILCYRSGADLIWWNGHVTRGNYEQPVLDDPTGSISSDYTAIVGKLGSTIGNAEWALNMALNTLSTNGGNGTLGQGRQIRALAQRGLWQFARVRHRYGDGTDANQGALYNTTNNVFEVQGQGAGVTKINLNPIAYAARTDVAEIDIRGLNRIVLRDLTISSSPDNVATYAGYLLMLEAHEVILERCHFIGSIMVAADRLTVRDCHFAGNAGAHMAGQLDLVASQHLTILGEYGTGSTGNASYRPAVPHPNITSENFLGPISWTIEGCTFVNNNSSQQHASVIVAGSPAANRPQPRVRIANNQWIYASNQWWRPSIDIRTDYGYIVIEDNQFLGAAGYATDGSAGGLASVTNDNDMPGSLLQRIGATFHFTASAYISVVKGRNTSSKLSISRNLFDMTKVGDHATNLRYHAWAATAVISNIYSNGGVAVDDVATVRVSNIEYTENHHLMYVEGSGWTANNVNRQPVIHGFICGPDVPYGVGVTDYICQNIKVVGNTFNLGGHDTAARMWRSVLGPILTWPATGKWMYHTSCCISVFAGNGGSSGDGADGNGRTCRAITIKENNFYQQPATGAAILATSTVYLGVSDATTGLPETDNDIWGCLAIGLSAAWVGFRSSAGGGFSSQNDYEGAIYARVAGNELAHIAFRVPADTDSGRLVAHYSAVWMGGFCFIDVIGNTFQMRKDATDHVASIEFTGQGRVLVASNNIQSYWTKGVVYVGNNLLIVPDPTDGTLTPYTGGTSESNWKV